MHFNEKRKEIKKLKCYFNIQYFRINPVTGHVELPQVSPFEGMTEEQKEYEATRLANLMHKLSDLGVVKPGKIGPNGTTRIFK